MKREESKLRCEEQSLLGLADKTTLEGVCKMLCAKLVGPAAVGFFQEIEEMYLFKLVF